MDKKTKLPSRLTLNRETVRLLNERELAEAAGGGATVRRSCGAPFTACPLCDPIT